jgi:uncharacterized protein YlxP (DUF503 family)
MKAFIGTLQASLYFPSAQTRKDRRSFLRALESRLRNAGLCCARTGPEDFVKRAWLTAVCVSGNLGVAEELVAEAVRIIHGAPGEVTHLETGIIETEASEDQ